MGLMWWYPPEGKPCRCEWGMRNEEWGMIIEKINIEYEKDEHLYSYEVVQRKEYL